MNWQIIPHTIPYHSTSILIYTSCAGGCEAFSASSIPLLRIIYFNIHIYNCVQCISQFYTQNIFGRCDFLNCLQSWQQQRQQQQSECCSRLYVGFCYSLMSPFSLLSLFIAWETIGHFEVRIIFAKSVSFAFISLCSEALFYLSECFSGCFFSSRSLTLDSFFKFHYSANAMLLQTVIEGGNVGRMGDGGMETK